MTDCNPQASEPEMFCDWRQECASTETTWTNRRRQWKRNSTLRFELTREAILSVEDLSKGRKSKERLGSEWASRLETKESLDRGKKSFWKIRKSVELLVERSLQL